VKSVLIGLLGGVLLTAAVLTLEMIHAERSVSAKMADCHTNVLSDRTDLVCDSAMQVGGWELPVTFVVGFAAAFVFARKFTRIVIAVPARRRQS
jgi:hypothetical protein